ncbi:MAG: hypothetical protein J6X25_02875 [Bacteroidales bacterium]|nr:hypothetical protein [Bacteroidales bacterium]
MVLPLMVACIKDVDTPSSAPEVQTVHYRAAISTDVETRATLGEGMVYKYETGDRVYLESEDGSLYGFLDMADGSGVGNHEAFFEGTLTYVGALPRDPDPLVRLVLVGATDDLHTITGGKVDAVTASSYGQDKWASSLEDAVRRLSHFTGSGHLMDNNFTIHQQSSFLQCSVSMTANQAPVNRVITARLLNNNVPIREVDITVTHTGKLPFVFAFLGGEVSLENAQLVIEWTDSENTDQSKDFTVADQTLAVNTYYKITRYTYSYDGFCITAISNGTTIKFNYDGIQYSVDYGDTWKNYTGQFTLNADGVAWIKGSRTDYRNAGTDQWETPSNKPIFEANNKCYISGNIMSLLASENTLSESAFQGAFSKGSNTPVTYIDIHPDNPLILPVTTLASKCYMQMFRNCTSLTRAPKFRVEGTAYRCCYNMLRQCTSLVDMSDVELPAQTLSEDCYREMIRQCSKLKTMPILPAQTLAKSCYQQLFSGSGVKTVICLATDISATDCLKEWMSGAQTSGTFYKAPNVTYPVGINGILEGWDIVDYTQ